MGNTQIKFCPICAGNMVFDKSEQVLVCDRCGYKFWRNSKPTTTAIIIRDGKVLLGKRSTKKMFGLWDGPGGFLGNGEELLEGLKREVMEEVGVRVRVKEFINSARESDPDNPLEDANVLALQFLCEIEEGEPDARDETSEVKWFSKEELPWDEIAFEGVKSALRIVFKIDKPYITE